MKSRKLKIEPENSRRTTEMIVEGRITNLRHLYTKKYQRPMATFSIVVEDKVSSVIIFPNAYEECESLVAEGPRLLFQCEALTDPDSSMGYQVISIQELKNENKIGG